VIELQGETTRVLVEQLCALDYSRLGDRVGGLAHEELADVDRALDLLLGLRAG
jgi:mRNA-degrading endonuclease toxin of MazEF toxin-antitoxin module